MYHQWSLLAFSWGQFTEIVLDITHCNLFENYIFENAATSPRVIELIHLSLEMSIYGSELDKYSFISYHIIYSLCSHYVTPNTIKPYLIKIFWKFRWCKHCHYIVCLVKKRATEMLNISMSITHPCRKNTLRSHHNLIKYCTIQVDNSKSWK